MRIAGRAGCLAANTSLRMRAILLGIFSSVLLEAACVHEEYVKPKHAGQETRPGEPIVTAPETGDPVLQLGPSTLEIVSNAERVLFADLGSVSANEAQDPSSLRDPERDAGYPLLHE